MQQSSFEPIYKKYGKDNVDAVRSTVLENLPRLQKGIHYKAEFLLGREAWEVTSPNEHLTIGHIISDLVKAGLLPLNAVHKTSGNIAQYCLAD